MKGSNPMQYQVRFWTRKIKYSILPKSKSKTKYPKKIIGIDNIYQDIKKDNEDNEIKDNQQQTE